jgi:hypothetical protein
MAEVPDARRSRAPIIEIEHVMIRDDAVMTPIDGRSLPEDGAVVARGSRRGVQDLAHQERERGEDERGPRAAAEDARGSAGRGADDGIRTRDLHLGKVAL